MKVTKVLVPVIGLLISTALHAETEEQRLIRISKNLKPISDSQWNEILSGSAKSDVYEIIRGDTLWSISQRLFGNPQYWPKVWALNNPAIGNPHWVAPGDKLVFTPGTSASLPQLRERRTQPRESDEVSPLPLSGTDKTHEYDKVSPDRWKHEDPSKQELQNYDEYGIDKELKINIPSKFVFRVPSIANDAKLPWLGEIQSSRRDGVGLGQHDTVFIESPNQDLQVGTTYSVLAEPESLSEKRSDRTAYIYHSLGEIKIIGVKDELYIGSIEKSYDVIRRGDRLYPILPLITDVKPTASNNALEALALFSSSKSTTNSAQFHFVHLDRGVEDGVQIGNVFRIYEYHDPVTRKKITDSDFLIQADAMVVHTTSQFSTAMVLRSRDTFTSGDFGVLLTDVTDLEKQLKNLPQSPETTPEDKELDELDVLDQSVGEGMGKQEEAEIKELENWDKTKDLQTQPNAEPTIPGDASAPSDIYEQFPDNTEPTVPSTETRPIEPGASGEPAPNTEQLPSDGTQPNSDFQTTPGVEPWQETAPDDVEMQKNK